MRIMWKLEKPNLDEALGDIERIIEQSNGAITQTDASSIIYAYRIYDRNGGKITSADNMRISQTVQNKLYNMYDQKTYEKQSLHYLRKELFKLADICPMCGVGEPSQLDHQIPRRDYKSLSLCRLNLVPLCGVCNNKKKDKNPNDFIHPYYAKFPKDAVFLVADIHINERTHKMSWIYKIETNATGISIELSEQINKQVSAIKLIRRLQKASNNYLADLFCKCNFFSDESLKSFIQMEMNKAIYRYGRNDWRSTLLCGLFSSPKFKKEEANEFAVHITPVNRGVNV